MIVIFGGTFNPIHLGHKEIIDKISSLVDVDIVLIVPTKIPPHKTASSLANEIDRVEMCKLIASQYDNVEVCCVELERKGKSYTIDTLHEIKRRYPGFDIAITIGADMVVTFDEWKDYLQIVKLCRIITFKRGDTDISSYREGIKKLKQYGADIIEIYDEITDISSTEIRNAILNNEDTSEYLDSSVANYITEHGVYGE